MYLCLFMLLLDSEADAGGGCKIRFHILAMHELCEYAKGEGFSEGFDAHLNIEQMNKASVDLFHMYDDLRKSGITCVSEAEFRGYYALLKLDKHPGYVVYPFYSFFWKLFHNCMISTGWAAPYIFSGRWSLQSCHLI